MRADRSFPGLAGAPREGRDLAGARDRALAQVRAALEEIRYGSIEIVIQDSRVVQIERREKFRPDEPMPRSPR